MKNILSEDTFQKHEQFYVLNYKSVYLQCCTVCQILHISGTQTTHDFQHGPLLCKPNETSIKTFTYPMLKHNIKS